MTSILRAPASKEFATSPSTTLGSEGIVFDDLIWAATSGGSGRIEALLSGISDGWTDPIVEAIEKRQRGVLLNDTAQGGCHFSIKDSFLKVGRRI